MGLQSKLAFSKDKRHCDVIISDGNAIMVFQHTGRGIESRALKSNNIRHVIRRVKVIDSLMHYIIVSVIEPKCLPWKPFITNSCNEICRKIALVETGWTFNPEHLYTKLIKFDTKRNFTILAKWSRKNGDI